MQKFLKALFPVVFLMSAPFLQAQQPFIQSANNAANYDPTAIARGSMFVIFGNSLGPGTLVSATQLPLPNALAGTSVTVKSGNLTLTCPMFYTSFGQVVAVMPSNTPLGTATVSVTFNNQSSGQFSATTNVVASSVGMFTPGSTGLGPGIFTDALTGALITLANPAIPGEILTGWATGVGALAGYDNTVPPGSALVNSTAVQVWVGGQAAQMSYAGRSGCCVAVDQLNFFVPKTGVVPGCSVPVLVSSGGQTSATTTIPIGPTAGTPCSDIGPALPSNLLTKAAAGTPLKVGVIAIAPTSTLQPAARQPKYVADQLSAALHVPVSVEDATNIMHAAEAHNSKALKSALSKYSAQWKALSARARARLADAVGGQAIEVIGLFGTVTSEGFAASTISAQVPPAGSCVLLPNPFPTYFGAVSTGLDAGASLSLVGAAGSITIQKKTLGDYEAPFHASPTGGDIPTGSYTLSGNGHDLTFSVTVTVAGHPTISNKAALAQIDRSQPLTVNWTGGTPGQFVMIGGFSSNHNTGLPPQIAAGKRDFICSEAAEKGTFTVPTYVMQSLWPTPDASGGLLLSYGPTSQPLNIPGLDGAWFVDGSSDEVKHIVFK